VPYHHLNHLFAIFLQCIPTEFRLAGDRPMGLS
jgi:hypothetical protein